MEKNEIKALLAEEQMASDELVQAMLDNIGNPDDELRDEIIYSGWVRLLRGNRVTTAQKQYLFDEVMNRRLLFFNIAANDESVLTRSFSALLLAALVKNHLESNWLSMRNQRWLINAAQGYMGSETDYRGYVEEYGWAHAFAHGADLLESIAKLEEFFPEDALENLQLIQRAVVDIGEFLYSEEGRLVKATIPLTSKLSDKVLSEWVVECQQKVDEKGYYNVWWQNYLKSLHLMLDFENCERPILAGKVRELLQDAYQKYGVI